MTDLPVVVVHHDAPDWLRSSITTIKASRGVTPRVVVVDNSDNAPAIDGVELIRPGANLGYTGGANLGLRRWLGSGGEFCVVASLDLHVEPGTLAALVACASATPEIGILGPAANDIRRDGQVDTVTDASWLSGSCLLFRRACLEQIGLFDEAMGSYCEDVDICWRARAAGWRVAVAPGISVHGLGSASPRSQHLICANTMYLLAKHQGVVGLGKGLLAVPWNAVVDARRRRWDRLRARVTSLPAGVRMGLVGVRTGRALRPRSASSPPTIEGDRAARSAPPGIGPTGRVAGPAPRREVQLER